MFLLIFLDIYMSFVKCWIGYLLIKAHFHCLFSLLQQLNILANFLFFVLNFPDACGVCIASQNKNVTFFIKLV